MPEKFSDQRNKVYLLQFLMPSFDSTGKRCNIRNNLQKNDRTSGAISVSEGLSCTTCILRMVEHAYKYQEQGRVLSLGKSASQYAMSCL
jgi:hypothetical protein